MPTSLHDKVSTEDVKLSLPPPQHGFKRTTFPLSSHPDEGRAAKGEVRISSTTASRIFLNFPFRRDAAVKHLPQ